MIALQSLKYKIFEWCLDTLVDRLLSNLLIKPIDISGLIRVEDLHVGMKLSKIELCASISARENWDIFKDCEILKIVIKKRPWADGDAYEIQFSYKSIAKIGFNLQASGCDEDNKDIESWKANTLGYSINWVVDSRNQSDSRFYI